MSGGHSGRKIVPVEITSGNVPTSGRSINSGSRRKESTQDAMYSNMSPSVNYSNSTGQQQQRMANQAGLRDVPSVASSNPHQSSHRSQVLVTAGRRTSVEVTRDVTAPLPSKSLRRISSERGRATNWGQGANRSQAIKAMIDDKDDWRLYGGVRQIAHNGSGTAKHPHIRNPTYEEEDRKSSAEISKYLQDVSNSGYYLSEADLAAQRSLYDHKSREPIFDAVADAQYGGFFEVENRDRDRHRDSIRDQDSIREGMLNLSWDSEKEQLRERERSMRDTYPDYGNAKEREISVSYSSNNGYGQQFPQDTIDMLWPNRSRRGLQLERSNSTGRGSADVLNNSTGSTGIAYRTSNIQNPTHGQSMSQYPGNAGEGNGNNLGMSAETRIPDASGSRGNAQTVYSPANGPKSYSRHVVSPGSGVAVLSQSLSNPSPGNGPMNNVPSPHNWEYPQMYASEMSNFSSNGAGSMPMMHEHMNRDSIPGEWRQGATASNLSMQDISMNRGMYLTHQGPIIEHNYLDDGLSFETYLREGKNERKSPPLRKTLRWSDQFGQPLEEVFYSDSLHYSQNAYMDTGRNPNDSCCIIA